MKSETIVLLTALLIVVLLFVTVYPYSVSSEIQEKNINNETIYHDREILVWATMFPYNYFYGSENKEFRDCVNACRNNCGICSCNSDCSYEKRRFNNKEIVNSIEYDLNCYIPENVERMDGVNIIKRLPERCDKIYLNVTPNLIKNNQYYDDLYNPNNYFVDIQYKDTEVYAYSINETIEKDRLIYSYNILGQSIENKTEIIDTYWKEVKI